MSFLWALFLGVSVTQISLAAPAAIRVVNDKDNMPVCVQDASGTKGFYLLWDESLIYTRELYYMEFSSLRKMGMGRVNCSEWKTMRRLSWAVSQPVTLKNGKVLAEIEVPDRVLKAMEQIRYGGNIYHSEDDAIAFLNNRPGLVYTLEKNKELSKKYGMRFSSRVYKAWIEKKPVNAKFKQEALENIELVRNNKAASLRELYKDIKVVGTRGYLQSPMESNIQKAIWELQSFGVDASVLETDTSVAVEDNARLIFSQLLEHLEQGTDLVVVSASKGMAEMFAALTMLGEYAASNDMTGKGRILGVVNFCGLVGGSFVAEWGQGMVQYQIAKWIMSRKARRGGLSIPEFGPGFKSLTKTTRGRYRRTYGDWLPQEPVYVNVVGITTKTGLADDEGLKSLQSNIFENNIFPEHGANDGLIEYPLTALTDDEVDELYELVLDSGHSLLKGTFDGLELELISNRRLVIYAFFLTLHSRMANRFLQP